MLSFNLFFLFLILSIDPVIYPPSSVYFIFTLRPSSLDCSSQSQTLNSPASASLVADITSVHHQARPLCCSLHFFSSLVRHPIQDQVLSFVVMSLLSHLFWNISSAFVFYDIDIFEEQSLLIECSSFWICLLFSHGQIYILHK